MEQINISTSNAFRAPRTVMIMFAYTYITPLAMSYSFNFIGFYQTAFIAKIIGHKMRKLAQLNLWLGFGKLLKEANLMSLYSKT